MIKLFIQKLHNALDKQPAVFMIVLSCALNCFVELMGRRSLLSLITYIATRPHIFLLNTAIIICTFLIAVFVVRRSFAVMMVSSFWLICGITNFAIIAFRASPFTARDILLIGYGLRIADIYLSPLQIVLIVTVLCIMAVGTVIAFVRLPKVKTMPKLKHIIITWVPLVAIIILIASAVSKNVKTETNGVLEAYDEFGFAYCFANSLLSSGIDKPDNYSMESVSNIYETISEERTDATQVNLSNANIIFIQLESFVDPAMIEGLSMAETPIPVFTDLKERFPSGYLTVPVVGGSTANVEFEVLTGLSSRLFALGEFPYETVLRRRGCESIAYNLKELGYTADAIHNHNGTFYWRNIVYSYLGFDRFVPLEYMQNVEYTPIGWAKDSVLADCILECMDITESPDFIFAVTVQGHGKYPEDFDNGEIYVTAPLPYDSIAPGELEYYITQLSETDAFIGDLIETLGCLDENVVTVLYGDHLPALPLTEDDLTTDSLYQTEYVIWSNFPISAEDKDLYSYELSAYVLGLLDIDNGIITKYHQSNDHTTAMDSIPMTLGYDMLYGENFVNGGEDVYAPTELQMGLDPICINNAYTDESSTYVEGENFTPFSVINIDGQRMETEYISAELLQTPHELEPGDIISVSQCGSDRSALSNTEDYIYDSAD